MCSPKRVNIGLAPIVSKIFVRPYPFELCGICYSWGWAENAIVFVARDWCGALILMMFICLVCRNGLVSWSFQNSFVYCIQVFPFRDDSRLVHIAIAPQLFTFLGRAPARREVNPRRFKLINSDSANICPPPKAGVHLSDLCLRCLPVYAHAQSTISNLAPRRYWWRDTETGIVKSGGKHPFFCDSCDWWKNWENLEGEEFCKLFQISPRDAFFKFVVRGVFILRSIWLLCW